MLLADKTYKKRRGKMVSGNLPDYREKEKNGGVKQTFGV